MSRNWKDFLLKSSLPLEYEVKQIIEKLGCISDYEYGYFREDENKITNEFTYDIDATYINSNHFFNLMIECKYRDPSTNWIFLPESYGGKDEIEAYSFVNPNDHFVESNFQRLDYEPFAPLCSKGIELVSDNFNPKSITQAVSQLSYAVVEKTIENICEQISEDHDLFHNTIFCNVPIIITTANLYRLTEGMNISQIKSSTKLEDVAVKMNTLVVKTNVTKDLENYNLKKFDEFIKRHSLEYLTKKLNSFNNDPNFVFRVIAKHYSPSSMVIIQLTDDHKNIEDLFTFLNEVVTPSEKTWSRLQAKKRRMDEIGLKFETMLNQRKLS